ncbi:MAG: hypothetical protein LUG98_12940 [Tannerellaceae bacterium]|nr:hypothetical protein [Tannerellaceae bacterium]
MIKPFLMRSPLSRGTQDVCMGTDTEIRASAPACFPYLHSSVPVSGFVETGISMNPDTGTGQLASVSR